ncbi:SIR2 family protein [Candidatus Pacearchaeota archaeon]|nr:SIR2 family protein [Bacteroidales bacterium]MCK5604884.1 SIR2 family protein [Candidatus Pacearchaeota archaeon]
MIPKENSQVKQKSISLLIGAGFSAPIGYPVGNKLNQLLIECDGSKFSFHSDGSLITSKDGNKPNIGYKTSYDFEFDFCRDLMQYFNSTRGYFDYEEFYDFFNLQAKEEPEVEKLLKSGNYGTEKNVDQMLFSLKNIYSQLVSYYLKDGEGKSWYDDEGHMGGPIWPGYTGTLNCLKSWSSEHIINVHTLNHDLFFERLNYSDWIQGELCDGFEENGSPYYGELISNGRTYRSRLERYTGNYNKKFRLYKLHGSKDYGIHYEPNGAILTPEKYVKTRFGIGFSELYKEIKTKSGEIKYDRCWINYHADFLTGTTSKIERYAEPLLFKTLFQHFKSNLNEAEKLIIIGYGGKDSEINQIISDHFDYKDKLVYILDPYPSNLLNNLKERIGAKLINKQLEFAEIKDFE